MSNILLTNGILYDKLKTHKLGLSHYAFSVFLFDKNNNLLMQKRAKCKYHSGGLWSNSCCSHFRDNNEFENKEQTINNRIKEELGVVYSGKLEFLDVFSYNKHVGELIENETDYIFRGFIDNVSLPIPFNKNEVETVKFMSIEEVNDFIRKDPASFTIWFKLIFENNLLRKKLFTF